MRILISEDNPVASRVLEATLKKLGHEVVVTTDGEAALAAMTADDAPPIAIIDWEMPKLSGIEVCRRLREATIVAPAYLILLTAKSTREALVEGLDAGADDFLTKPFDQSELRVRIQAGARITELQRTLSKRVADLENAIVERQRAEDALRMLSLTDDLTGLLNRRGFHTLADHQLKAARRSGLGSMLIYGDLDGLKAINDTLGHNVGSEAIVAMAEIMRQTFRESDLLCRLGGDEFVILVGNVEPTDGPAVLGRFQRCVDAWVEQNQPKYRLAISAGAAFIEAANKLGIEELTRIADQAMYRNKRMRRESARVGAELPLYNYLALVPEYLDQPDEVTVS
jgi:two-component system cell cycle response regulator